MFVYILETVDISVEQTLQKSVFDTCENWVMLVLLLERETIILSCLSYFLAKVIRLKTITIKV